MRHLTLAVIGCALVAAACGGDGSGEGAGSEADLRDAVETSIQAFLDGDVDTFYDSFADSFQARCDEKGFKGVMALAGLLIGEIDAEVQVSSVAIDGNRATVEVEVKSDDPDLEVGDSGEGGFADFWVYEHGKWKADTDDPAPCDLGSAFEGGGDGKADSTPVSGPGTSRSEAVVIGDTVSTAGIDVTVVRADLDAADAVADLNEFAELHPGNRFVLVTVRIRYEADGSDETRQVSSSDFKLTGSHNLLYDSFDPESSCGGFLDGELRDELFPGGEIEGLVCFQIPRDETDVILVVEPFFSFEDADRRFIALD